MKLSQRTVVILISLMVIALSGLLYLQYRFLQRSLELKDESFRQNVHSALTAAVALIEEADVRDRFFLFASDTNAPPMTFRQLGNHGQREGKDTGRTLIVSTFTTSRGSSSSLVDNHLSYQLGEPQQVTIKMFDAFGRLDTVLVDTKKGKGTHEILLPGDRLKGAYFIQVRTDSMFSTHKWNGTGSGVSFNVPATERTGDKLIRRVTEVVRGGTDLPLTDRVSKEQLDSALTRQFRQNGIDLPYTYEVRGSSDSLVIARISDAQPQTRAEAFTIPMFAHDFSGQPATLLVWFPGYKSHLLGEFLPESVLHLVFVGVVLACFWYSIRTLMRQKHFGERVADFINNMTHEFKTPLSTIALASEALDRPDVLRVKKKIATYNRVIAEENTRMRKQVEKILHMAALEEGEFEFRRDVLEMHALIEQAVSAAAVQVSARQGSISTSLGAHRSNIIGDGVHIENVVRTVLDNAEKYSSESPRINVGTSNTEKELIVRVSDQGIGMTKEQMDRAFDKYYRAHTGNVHDVKGFGIGLSYVKLVVQGHGGSVSMQSEKGKGTTLEMRFPTAEL
jgi:signal transduction histidine kinase